MGRVGEGGQRGGRPNPWAMLRNATSLPPVGRECRPDGRRAPRSHRTSHSHSYRMVAGRTTANGGRRTSCPPAHGYRPPPLGQGWQGGATGPGRPPSLVLWPYAFAAERCVLLVAYFLFTEVTNVPLNIR